MDDRTNGERLAAIEVKITFVCKQMTNVHTKLDTIIPLVKENSWWIEKIKWGFVIISIMGVTGGIVRLAWS